MAELVAERKAAETVAPTDVAATPKRKPEPKEASDDRLD
jgi:hypothetical protein